MSFFAHRAVMFGLQAAAASYLLKTTDFANVTPATDVPDGTILDTVAEGFDVGELEVYDKTGFTSVDITTSGIEIERTASSGGVGLRVPSANPANLVRVKGRVFAVEWNLVSSADIGPHVNVTIEDVNTTPAASRKIQTTLYDGNLLAIIYPDSVAPYSITAEQVAVGDTIKQWLVFGDDDLMIFIKKNLGGITLKGIFPLYSSITDYYTWIYEYSRAKFRVQDITITETLYPELLEPTVKDTFDEIDGTNITAHETDTGQQWSQDLGNDGFITVNSNEVRIADSASANLATFDSSLNDFCATFNWDIRGGNSGGATFRGSDANNYFIAQCNQSLNNLEIYEKTSGSFALRAGSSMTINTNSTGNASLMCVDDSIVFYANGDVDSASVSYSSSSKKTNTRFGVTSGTYFAYGNLEIHDANDAAKSAILEAI